MATVTMTSKFYVKLPDFSKNDPRYDADGLNINGRTLQDLKEHYKNNQYLSRDSQRLIYDSRFMVIPDSENEETPYILITDIGENYGDSHIFNALALKIGDTTNDKGHAKVYHLNWEVTNPEAERPEEKIVLKNLKVVDADYSTEFSVED